MVVEHRHPGALRPERRSSASPSVRAGWFGRANRYSFRRPRSWFVMMSRSQRGQRCLKQPKPERFQYIRVDGTIEYLRDSAIGKVYAPTKAWDRRWGLLVESPVDLRAKDPRPHRFQYLPYGGRLVDSVTGKVCGLLENKDGKAPRIGRPRYRPHPSNTGRGRTHRWPGKPIETSRTGNNTLRFLCSADALATRYRLLPTTCPKGFDLIERDDKHVASRAIYSLEGDTLTMAHFSTSEERPKDFRSIHDQEKIIRVFRREKSP